MKAVELSALRLPELPALIEELRKLDLNQFKYISFHAPSRFSAEEEGHVVELLQRVPKSWPIIVHPDAIHDPKKWIVFGRQIAIENMDRRKSTGRSAEELRHWFELFPDARLCLDLAHTHQCDRTMTEAYRILKKFSKKICQLHISELDSAGHHFPLSLGTISAFLEIKSLIPTDTPAIIESINPFADAEDREQVAWIERELQRASTALGRVPQFQAASISPAAIEIEPAHALA